MRGGVKAKPFGKRDAEKDRSVGDEVIKVVMILDQDFEASELVEEWGEAEDIASEYESLRNAPSAEGSHGWTKKKMGEPDQHVDLEYETDAEAPFHSPRKRKLSTAQAPHESLQLLTPAVQASTRDNPSISKPPHLSFQPNTPPHLSPSTPESLHDVTTHITKATADHDRAEARLHEARVALARVREFRQPGNQERVEREVREWEGVVERLR